MNRIEYLLQNNVGVGLLLAVIVFVKKMSASLIIAKVLPDPSDKLVKSEIVEKGSNCPQISIYTIEGSLFFGSTEVFEKSIENILQSKPRVLLLRMSKVSFIDTSGEAMLLNIAKRFKEQNKIILISGIQQQPKELLWKTGLHQEIGEKYFFERTGDAINYALAQLETKKCIGCKQFAFSECSKLSQQAAKAKQKETKLLMT